MGSRQMSLLAALALIASCVPSPAQIMPQEDRDDEHCTGIKYVSDWIRGRQQVGLYVDMQNVHSFWWIDQATYSAVLEIQDLDLESSVMYDGLWGWGTPGGWSGHWDQLGAVAEISYIIQPEDVREEPYEVLFDRQCTYQGCIDSMMYSNYLYFNACWSELLILTGEN